MATASSTPRKRTTAKAAPAKAAAKPVSDSQETVDENGLVREVYVLLDKGRTRNGEGNEQYWNLHDKGARGQIFTPADAGVVEVKVLVVRNPNAVTE